MFHYICGKERSKARVIFSLKCSFSGNYIKWSNQESTTVTSKLIWFVCWNSFIISFYSGFQWHNVRRWSKVSGWSEGCSGHTYHTDSCPSQNIVSPWGEHLLLSKEHYLSTLQPLLLKLNWHSVSGLHRCFAANNLYLHSKFKIIIFEKFILHILFVVGYCRCRN